MSVQKQIQHYFKNLFTWIASCLKWKQDAMLMKTRRLQNENWSAKRSFELWKIKPQPETFTSALETRMWNQRRKEVLSLISRPANIGKLCCAITRQPHTNTREKWSFQFFFTIKVTFVIKNNGKFLMYFY